MLHGARREKGALVDEYFSYCAILGAGSCSSRLAEE